VRFCAGFVDHDNITRAHREAGFEAASDNAHAVAGKKLLRKAQIRRYIRNLQDAATEAAGVTAADLVRAFKRIALADLAALYDADGQMLPPHRWPECVRLCVRKVRERVVVEDRPDPTDATKVIKVAVTRYEVEFESKTESLKVLAAWKRLVGPDSDTLSPQGGGSAPPDPAAADAGTFADAAKRLAGASAEAAEVLKRLLTSTSSTVRAAAASRLIELGVKVNELADLQKRVEEIEKQVAQTRGTR
jgi:phage terminase small subunit